MWKSLHYTGVTSQRPSTPAQPPPHCYSTALRVVTGVGRGFPVVVSVRLWVRWVGLWHSRWKSLPRDPKKGVGGVRDSRDRVPKTSQRLERQSLKKSSRPGQPKAVGRVKASGNLYIKSSRPGLSSETGQVKASGAQSSWPVQ